MAQANYVKFLRGTTDAYNNLTKKDADTLYFVMESKDSEYGKLYLGDKLISVDVADANGGIALKELKDVIINNNITNGSLLSYNSITRTWSPKTIGQAIAEADLNLLEMVGATASQDGQSGLVPVPQAGTQSLFLRGDATWQDPTVKITQTVSGILQGASNNANTFAKVEARLLNLETQNNNFALKTEVGNISDLGKPYVEPSSTTPTTIINEINHINEKLIWQPIPKTF